MRKRAFVLAELLLFCAIPLLSYAGFRTLLDTRTGTFVEDLGPDAPGWQALLDPSPVVGVVEMDNDRVTGIAVVASIGQTARGGAVILIPAEMEAEAGQPLSSLSPEAAIDAVANSMELRIPTVEVADADRWGALLDGTSYSLNNPDPVPGDEGEVLFGVGQVEVSGDKAAAFLGRTVDGSDSLASLVRRELFWERLLGDPPAEQDDDLSRTILAISAGPHEVIRFPIERAESGAAVPSVERVEVLVRRVVAFPAGASAGHRFTLRIEDRTGSADLDAVAREMGGLGVEVVSISNGSSFDAADTAFRVAPDFERTEDLKARFPEVEVVISPLAMADDPVVLQLGPNHEAILAEWVDTAR